MYLSPNIVTVVKWRRVEMAKLGGRLKLWEMLTEFERETLGTRQIVPSGMR
jgi:hypothetical protein